VKKDEFIYVSNINVLSTVQRRIDELLKKIWQREREREREHLKNAIFIKTLLLNIYIIK